MSKTKIKEIVDYWSVRKDETNLSIDWVDAHERCWRCGYKTKLQKCHITPASLGGTDSPSNLVLLCSRCHREGPNIKNPKFMWIWIHAHATPLYETFWSIRGEKEFEKMFGRKPFSNIDNDSVSTKDLESLGRAAMNSAIVHFGEGHMNPSTIACILYEVEKNIQKNYKSD